MVGIPGIGQHGGLEMPNWLAKASEPREVSGLEREVSYSGPRGCLEVLGVSRIRDEGLGFTKWEEFIYSD